MTWNFVKYSDDLKKNYVYTTIGFAEKLVNSMALQNSHFGFHADLQPIRTIFVQIDELVNRCYTDNKNTFGQFAIPITSEFSGITYYSSLTLAKNVAKAVPASTTLDTIRLRFMTQFGTPVRFRGGKWSLLIDVETIHGVTLLHASDLQYQ